MKQAGAMNGFLLQKGWLFVADSKRITVCFPVSLLEEMDLLIDAENKCRSELVREAMRFYLWEKRKLYLREEMRKGYQEMACLNLALVEEFCFVRRKPIYSQNEK